MTKIEWTGRTWNVTKGCTRKSRGCDNCYAVRHTRRLAGSLPVYQGLVDHGKKHFNGTVRLDHAQLDRPFRWQKPQTVFVNSMSDLFHPDVPLDFVADVWAVMAGTPQHTYQVLTKRPEAMAGALGRLAPVMPEAPWPLPNVWLGTSVEDQAAADERIPHLLRCPAAVRFLSCEPLLGPVGLRPWIAGLGRPGQCFDIDGYLWHAPGGCRDCKAPLGWVIAGGESGPGARTCDVAWLRSLRDQCQAAGVPFFLKQLGAAPVRPPDGQYFGPAHALVSLRDRKGGDPEEWSEDLRVRQMPQPAPGLAPPTGAGRREPEALAERQGAPAAPAQRPNRLEG